MEAVQNVPSALEEKDTFLKMRFLGVNGTGVFNLPATQFQEIPDFAAKFNNNLPGREGRLNANYLSIARELAYMLAYQVEEKRQEDEDQYLRYLSDEYKALPFETNNGEIASRMERHHGLKISKRTVQTALKVLAKAGILSSPKPGVSWKVNTSRRKEIVKNEDGSKTTIIQVTEKGRGNFWLHMNKEVCSMRYALRMAENDVQKSNFEGSGTPDFIDKRKNLLPNNIDILKGTLSIKNNKSSRTKSGVAPQQQEIDLTPQSGNENGTKRNNQKSGTSKVEFVNKTTNLKKVAKARRESGENYLRRQAFYERVDRKLEKTKKSLPDMAAFMLLAQVKNRLFSGLNDEYWEKFESKVIYQLKLHLKQMDVPIWTAFRYVDWGIDAAANYIEKNPEKYPKGMPNWLPIQYFRLDNIVKNDQEFMPQFKTVLQVWLPKYLERLSVDASHNQQFEKWQFIANEGEIAWRKVMIAFNQGGASNLSYEARMIKTHLIKCFNKYDIKREWQYKVIRSFEIKLEAFILELRKKGEEEAVFEWEKIHTEFSKLKVA